MLKAQPNDFCVSDDELRSTGAKPRVMSDHDPLARFRTVPNHAMFLFTSEDVILDKYIRNHWAALNGMSGEICDIYVSLTQLQDHEDAHSQLNDLRSIPGLESITPAMLPVMLPALHVWSADANITLSLKDVGQDDGKLRDALRKIFSSMGCLHGPISGAWVTQMRMCSPLLCKQQINGGAQAIKGSVAGRDIIQINNFYESAPSIGDQTMNASPTNQPQQPKGQCIEDAVADGKISQSSESVADLQVIRRASASGNISQSKRKTSQIKFMGCTATGKLGIVSLVILFLVWVAHQYF